MATAEVASTPFSDRLRDYQRILVPVITGAGVWAAIVIFLTWAFFQERDALVVGIVIGSIFSLGALGVTLVYGILKFGHFAHGDTMMFSAYLAFLFLTGLIAGKDQGSDTHALPVHVDDLPNATDKIWNFSFGYGLLIAMLIAAVAAAGLLILIDRLVYRTLRRRNSGIVTFSIASLGIALVVRSGMLMVWGADPRSYSLGIRKATDLPLDVRVLYDQMFIFGMALLLMALVYFLLYRTKLGKAMRAMADNADLARISGINTDRIVVWTWAVSGALVAIAGVMLGLQAQLKPELGFVVLLPLFAAAILGGIGSPHGALAGGMLVGIIQEVTVGAGWLSPGYKFAVAAIVLIIILLIRPRGLFGAKV